MHYNISYTHRNPYTHESKKVLSFSLSCCLPSLPAYLHESNMPNIICIYVVLIYFIKFYNSQYLIVLYMLYNINNLWINTLYLHILYIFGYMFGKLSRVLIHSVTLRTADRAQSANEHSFLYPSLIYLTFIYLLFFHLFYIIL